MLCRDTRCMNMVIIVCKQSVNGNCSKLVLHVPPHSLGSQYKVCSLSMAISCHRKPPICKQITLS